MGVLACNKNNCSHIMCDTYIDDIGYICNDCKEDFKKWLLTLRTAPKTEEAYKKCLKQFMDMKKMGRQESIESVDEFFSKYEKE